MRESAKDVSSTPALRSRVSSPEGPTEENDAQMWLGPVWAEHECEHAQREDS